MNVNKDVRKELVGTYNRIGVLPAVPPAWRYRVETPANNRWRYLYLMISATNSRWRKCIKHAGQPNHIKERLYVINVRWKLVFAESFFICCCSNFVYQGYYLTLYSYGHFKYGYQYTPNIIRNTQMACRQSLCCCDEALWQPLMSKLLLI